MAGPSVKRALPKQGYAPDLNKYLARKLRLKLNGGREVEGIVIGVDVFMNVALEKAYEIIGNERKILYKAVIRGNSILMWELLEKVVEWCVKNQYFHTYSRILINIQWPANLLIATIMGNVAQESQQ